MNRDEPQTDLTAPRNAYSFRAFLGRPIRVPENLRRSLFRHGVTLILALATASQLSRMPAIEALISESAWSVPEIGGPYGRSLQFFDQVLPAGSTVTVFKDSRFDRTERTRFQASYLLYPRIVRTGGPGDPFEYFVATSPAVLPPPEQRGRTMTYHGRERGKHVLLIFGSAISEPWALSGVPTMATKPVVMSRPDGTTIIRITEQIEGSFVLLVGETDVFEAVRHAPGVLEFQTQLPVDRMKLSLLRASNPTSSRPPRRASW